MTAEPWPSANLVASSALAFYSALPKNGKPQPNEFTVFAAFLLSSGHDRALRVVAAGTGTKCLPGCRRSAQGSSVSDCHAEALARRALLAWLYGEAELAVEEPAAALPGSRRPAYAAGAGEPTQEAQQQRDAAQPRGSSVLRFEPSSGLLLLKPEVQLHMYVSQPPCGDASIIVLEPAAGPQAAGREMGGSSEVTAGGPVELELEDASMQDVGTTGACCASIAAAAAAACTGPAPAPGQAASQTATPCAEPGLRLRTGAKALKLMHPPGGPAAAAAAAAAVAAATQGQLQQQGEEKQVLEEEQALLVQPAPLPSLAVASRGDGAAAAAGGPGQQGGHAAVLLPTASDVEDGAQEVGLARRKPGKGAPTLSMSCSDKLSRWACLGLQGSLLGALMARPVRLTSLTVAAPPRLGAAAGPASIAGAQQAAHRAVCGRLAAIVPQLPLPFGGPSGLLQRVAAVEPPPAAHGLAPSEQRTVGSGASISWYASPGCCLPREDRRAPPSGSSARPPIGDSSQQGPPSPPAAVNPAAMCQEEGVGDAGGAKASGWQGKADTVPLLRPSLGTLQVLAAGEGSKAGLPKAARADPRHWPALCRAALLERFCLLLEAQAAALLAQRTAPGPVPDQAAATAAAQLPPCMKILKEAVMSAAGAAPSAPPLGAAGVLVDGGCDPGHGANPAAALPDLEVVPALLALRSCTYGAVKRMCAQMGGFAAAWLLAQQPPSPFHCWIPKTDHLQAFTCKAFHEAHKK